MKLKQARDVALQRMVEEGSRIPGFCGAYAAGSMNWLPDTADLATGSDLDIMVVLAGQNQKRHKFIYHDTLLEISYLRKDQLQWPEQVLSDYHLAPSFRTTKVMFDPFGHLSPLLAVVSREYSKRQWVGQRCAHAKNKILAYPLYQRAISSARSGHRVPFRGRHNDSRPACSRSKESHDTRTVRKGAGATG